MGVKLTKRGDTWTTEFLGKERHFIMDNDTLTWRSMGISPTSAYLFETTPSGELLTVTDVRSGDYVEALDIPQQHVVAKMVRPTKLYLS